MKRVVWSRPARNDVFEIAGYYDRIDPALAEKMLDQVQAAAGPLLDNPRLGVAVPTLGVRKWSVRGTPYVLLYTIRGKDIEIRRVRHQSTDWLVE